MMASFHLIPLPGIISAATQLNGIYRNLANFFQIEKLLLGVTVSVLRCHCSKMSTDSGLIVRPRRVQSPLDRSRTKKLSLSKGNTFTEQRKAKKGVSGQPLEARDPNENRKGSDEKLLNHSVTWLCYLMDPLSSRPV